MFTRWVNLDVLGAFCKGVGFIIGNLCRNDPSSRLEIVENHLRHVMRLHCKRKVARMGVLKNEMPIKLPSLKHSLPYMGV